jgi:predicted nucleic acid-binding protein
VEAKVARDVMSRHPRLEPRDALHAAVVLVHGLEGIVSSDRGYDAVVGVTRFDPRDL